MFKQKVKVSNVLSPDKFFEQEFWVDTGALYSLVPQSHLEALGFEPEGMRTIVVADGRTSRKQFGMCKFFIADLNETVTCPVIAGDDNSLFLLGATALENFGVDADPVAKKLKPVLAIIGHFIASK